MKEISAFFSKRILNPPLSPFIKGGLRGIIFVAILLSLNMAHSQETEQGQESPPPSPSPGTLSGGEGRREGAETQVDAQIETAEEKGQESAPAPATEEQLSTLEVGITPKFQTIELDNESSKAREYRSIPDGLYIDNLLFNYGSQSQEFGGEFKKIYPLTNLIGDGYGNLHYRRYGLLDVDIRLSKFPHVYATPPSLDISAQRDTYNLMLKFTPGDRLIISTNLSIENRKGKRPLTVESFTGLISTPTAIVEITEPTEYATTTIDLGIEYLDDIMDIQLNNNLQIFSNTLLDEVTWGNPYSGSDGKAKVAEDHTVHTLSFRPAIKLTDNTRMVNTLSYSKVTGSIDLVPFTTVSGVGEEFLRNVLDSDVRSLTFSSILSTVPISDVRLNIKYRYYSYKNDTPKIEEPPSYVMIDGDSTAVRYPRIPRYTSYSKGIIGLDGTWSITNRLSVDAGLQNKDTTRDEREVDKENEKRLSLSLRSAISDNLSGRFGYVYARRRGGYDPTYYNAIYDPNPANDVSQHPMMRAFDLSGLDSNTVTASLDYSPVNALSLGAMLSIIISEHPDVAIGRRHSRGESASIYAQYMLFKDLLIYSEYYYDRRELKGSYTWTYNSNLTYPQDPLYSDFTRPVTGSIEDVANTYVIGFNYNIDQWLSITGKYSRDESTGTSITLPEVSSATDIYGINVSYRPYRVPLIPSLSIIHLKDIRIDAGYSMERYRREDYALDNFPVSGSDTDIFLGIREPDYRLSIFSVSLSLHF